MDEPQLTYRIGWIGGLLTSSLAFLSDFLQALLTFTLVLSPESDIVTTIAEVFVWFFFVMRGVKFLSGKRALSRTLTFFGETVFEMVPILNALPMLTIGTIYQIHTTRVEDKLEYEEAHAKWEEGEQRQRGVQQWNQRQSRLRQIATTAAMAGAAAATGGASVAAEGAVAASRAGQAARVAGKVVGTAERAGASAAERNLQNRSMQAVRRMGDITPRTPANDDGRAEEREAA